MKLVYTFGLILFLCRCNKEPVFEMPGPIDLYSWNLNKDTFWNATVILGGENISAKCVSNFEVNGIDTSTSFRLDFSKNNLKLQRLVLKIRNNLVSGVNVYSKNSLENIYLESENAIYGSNDIIVDSLKFLFNRKKDPKEDLNVSGLFLRLKTNSMSQKNITLEMGASLLNFKGTYLLIFQNGQQIDAEKYLLNVDLKGGSEYSPTPLFDYKPNLLAPNDFLFFNVPTFMLKGSNLEDVKGYIFYSKKGKYFPSESGKVRVNQFYYKNSISLNGYNWSFRDTINNVPIISFDSLELQSFAMPF